MNASTQAMVERFRRLDAEMHAPITDENMLGCIEEITEVLKRRGIAANCLLTSLTETITLRHEYPPEAS